MAIDLPGYGYSRGHGIAALQHQVAVASAGSGERGAREKPLVATAAILGEVIKSLGKHYAYMIIASSDGAAATMHALTEQPNLCSFVCLREPMVRDIESLHAIFQPSMLIAESDELLPDHATGAPSVVDQMSHNLLHCTLQEYSRRRTPKYLDKEFADEIVWFLAQRHWRGHLSGFGHSKRRPLLTRLAGGLRMWKGEKEFKEAKGESDPKKFGKK